jgi:hypothetical protein
VAAFTTWGGLGTLVFLWAMGKLRGDTRWRLTWIGLASVIVALWALATILAIILPVFVTGTDFTRIPIGAFFAPVAAAMLTALAGVVTSVFRRGSPDHKAGPDLATRSNESGRLEALCVAAPRLQLTGAHRPGAP